MLSDYFTVVDDQDSWEIDWNNLMLGRTLLGKGNFGEVREGAVWFGQKAIKVAVKMLKGDFFKELFQNKHKFLIVEGTHMTSSDSYCLQNPPCWLPSAYTDVHYNFMCCYYQIKKKKKSTLLACTHLPK